MSNYEVPTQDISFEALMREEVDETVFFVALVLRKRFQKRLDVPSRFTNLIVMRVRMRRRVNNDFLKSRDSFNANHCLWGRAVPLSLHFIS